MPSLPRLTPTLAQQRIRQLVSEHDAWVTRLATKYSRPRSEILRMLDRPGALEDEIAAIIIERAGEHARALFANQQPAPEGNDLYSRAVRGLVTRFVTVRDAEEAAQRQQEYEATDALLARIKAGEDIEL
jgi:hypothetical protein